MGDIFDTIEAKQDIFDRLEKKKPASSIGEILKKSLIGAGKETYAEVVSPIASGVSTAAFGLPKAAAEAAGLKEALFPEQRTFAGKTLRFGAETAGFLGGGAAKIGTRLAQKALPPMTRAALPITTRFLAEPLRRKAARGALQWGTAAALQTPEQGIRKPIATIPQRISAGAMGAAGGMTGEAISALTGKIPRMFRRAKTFKPGISERTSVLEKIAKEQAGVKQARLQSLKGRIETEVGLRKETSEEAIKVAKEQFGVKQAQVMEKAKQDLTKLTTKKNITAQKVSREVKRRLPQFSRDYTEAYGQDLEKIADDLYAKGQGLTRAKTQEILQKTDDEVQQMFLGEGKVSKAFKNLKVKYGLEASAEATPELAALQKRYGADLSKVADIQKSGIKLKEQNLEEILNFKEVLSDFKGVGKKVSAGAKGAEKAFTDDDIIAAILKKNFGEEMTTLSPEYAQLQADASKIIEQIKAARKLFKPGEPYTISEKSISTLTKPDIAEKELLKELMTGTPRFGKGMGKITQPITKAEQAIARRQKAGEVITQKLTQKSLQEQKTLSEAMEKRLSELYGRKVKVGEKESQIAEALKQRLGRIEARGMEVKKLAFKKKVGTIGKTILGTGGTGAGLAHYLIKRKIAREVLR